MPFCEVANLYSDAYSPPVGTENTENWRELWVRGYRRRRVKSLDAFVTHGPELRPDEWAVIVGQWDRRNAYRDLLRLHKQGYLLRKHDFWGRLKYRLSGRGARWLSKSRGLWL